MMKSSKMLIPDAVDVPGNSSNADVDNNNENAEADADAPDEPDAREHADVDAAVILDSETAPPTAGPSRSTAGAPTSNEACMVCHTAPRVNIIIPCCHYGICDTCKEQLEIRAPFPWDRKCPYCRKSNVNFVRMHSV